MNIKDFQTLDHLKQLDDYTKLLIIKELVTVLFEKDIKARQNQKEQG